MQHYINKNGEIYIGDMQPEDRPAAAQEVEACLQRIAVSETLCTYQQELSETDWYVIRAMENSKPIPEDIRQRREFLRTEISRLRPQS